jgi:hypothetical protein
MVSSRRTERVQEQTLLNLSLLPSPRFGIGLYTTHDICYLATE